MGPYVALYVFIEEKILNVTLPQLRTLNAIFITPKVSVGPCITLSLNVTLNALLRKGLRVSEGLYNGDSTLFGQNCHVLSVIGTFL